MGSKKVRTKPFSYSDEVVSQCANTVAVAVSTRNWPAAYSAIDYAQSQLEDQYLTLDSPISMLSIPTKAIAALESAGFTTVKSVANATATVLVQLPRFEVGWLTQIQVEVRRIVDAGGKVLISR